MYGPGNRGPSTASEWVISLLLLGGVFAAFLLVIFEDFEPVKLFPLFFAAFWVVLLPVHEAGHALTAALLGWYVRQVVIGFGPTLLRFRCGSALVEVRAFPIEGFVVPAPRDLRAPRVKCALIYFAGVGTELLLLGLVAALLGPRILLTQSQDVPIIAAQAFGAVVLASAFFNLVPHSTPMPDGRWAVNDGLGILRSFTAPREEFEEWARAAAEEDPWETWDADDRPGRR